MSILSTEQNKQDILTKLAILDTLLESLSKVHTEQEEKVEDLTKRISLKKVVLMDELLKLIGAIKIA